MPPLEIWCERFRAMGVNWQGGYDKNIGAKVAQYLSYDVSNPYVPKRNVDETLLVEAARRQTADSGLGYPLVCGFSDFFVIPSSSFDDFSHYCGVFAAMRMFVEVAIPTSMVLSCSKIVNLEALGLKAETGVINSARVRAELESKYELSFARFMQEYPADYLFIHPIKLSRWKDLP